MPIYDYECRACGHVVEVIHGVNDSGPSACPRCGGPMRKLMTSPAIVFRGSGWAKKDARTAARSGGSKRPEREAATAAESTGGNGSDKADKRSEPSTAPEKHSAGGKTASD